MLLRTVVAYELLAAAVGKGNSAFENATKFVIEAMTKSISKKLEVSLFYGQAPKGIGEVKAGSVTTNSFVISDAEFAPGIWVGAKGMKFDVYDDTGVTLKGSFTVASIDFDLRKVTTVESLVAAGVDDLDVIFPKGAKNKEAAGLHKILSNTGVLFDIDAAQYEMWKGNVVPAAGELTFEKLVKFMSRPIERGLSGDVVCIVNPKTWASLMKDQAALRRFDSSYGTKKLENGTMAIEFYSQNGKIEVHSSIYCKESYAYVIQSEDFARIGSTDITFQLPGLPDQFLTQAPNNAGYEMRCYSNQALFTKSISSSLMITGITHS